MESKRGKRLMYAVFLIALVVTVITIVNLATPKDPTLADVLKLFNDGEVAECKYNVETLKLTVVDKNKKEYVVQMPSSEFFRVEIYDSYLKENTEIKYDTTISSNSGAWLPYIGMLIAVAIVVGLFIFMMKQTSKGPGATKSFGKSKTRLAEDMKNKVYFKDVAGCDEEKAELEEIVDYLRDPKRFSELGAKIPHGVLLVGPPGTGKTLLAKAVAGEAGVPFYSLSGSDFVELYVGVGASRVRDLFETARKNPASIIFIDEIDAVGRHRGTGIGGGHDEREQTLNQLLVEMDGFSGTEGTIVIAATNRPDILDPALLRPGRFDRQVTVGYPDIKGREEILKVHTRKKPLEQSVDLHKIAQLTVGMTGAELANILNEAALLAARKGKALIGMNDIEEATLKVMGGTPKKSYHIRQEEKLKTAFHEAGHAILDHFLPTQDPVRFITVVPSNKGALGYTLSHPLEDKFSVYRQELIERIAALLGGRVAEILIYKDYSGGASSDIQRATQIARKMVTELGMSDLGPIHFGGSHSSDEVFLGRDFSSSPDYSDSTAAKIDEEVKKLIDSGYAIAEKVLTEKMDKLKFVAAFLVKYETMDGEQFARAMEEDDPTLEEINAIADEKRRISDEENEHKRELDEKERAEREKFLREHNADYDEENVNERNDAQDGKDDAQNDEDVQSGYDASDTENTDDD